MSALPPDYDTDPGRRRSWEAPTDVHDSIASELHGPILADTRALPLRSGAFAEVTHLWCLYQR